MDLTRKICPTMTDTWISCKGTRCAKFATCMMDELAAAYELEDELKISGITEVVKKMIKTEICNNEDFIITEYHEE